MKGLKRLLAAAAVAGASLIGFQEQPAGALTVGVLSGGGTMASVSGPGSTSTNVTGTISGTIIGTWGSCTFSTTFNGSESVIQANGGGGSFGCFPTGPCGFFYHRELTRLQLGGPCGPFGWDSFQVDGFAEPSSALPTTSYNFQVAGQHSWLGPIAINGNMSFSPSAPLGPTTGTLLPTSTGVTFTGTINGFMNGVIAPCNLSMLGGGSESLLTGSTVLNGVCNGPFGSTPCVMQWTHLVTQMVINGNCSGPLGFQMAGTGEIVVGSGGGYSVAAAITIV